MAVIGNANAPYELAAIELIGPHPLGNLVTPYETVELDDVSAIRTGRFPTPPVAWGFLETVDIEMVLGEDIGLDPPHVITGAVYPESGYLEPTIGQIWPRIG